MHWNHRLIEHRNSSNLDAEIYTTVHEVYYDDDGGALYWGSTPISPQTKQEAEWLVKAFDDPIVSWVDDASRVKEDFFDSYESWDWMPGVKVGKEEEDFPFEEDDDESNENSSIE